MLGKTLALLPFVLAALVAGGSSIAAEPIVFTLGWFWRRERGHWFTEASSRKPRPFHVQSRSSHQVDGTFRLEQTVTFGGAHALMMSQLKELQDENRCLKK